MIKIDMEMPECCRECRFYKIGVCTATIPFAARGQDEDEKPDWCPLVEVKDD